MPLLQAPYSAEYLHFTLLQFWNEFSSAFPGSHHAVIHAGLLPHLEISPI